MARSSDKRERLLQAADRLIHRQGFRQTTLSDIAADSGVPLGNVYYYFKTKEDIGTAVIEARMNGLQDCLADCESHTEPRARLHALLEQAYDARAALAEMGCPVGTLCDEMAHTDTPLVEAVRPLLARLIDWSRSQFDALGKPDAETLALEFVTRLQGMSLIANTLGDPAVITRMVERTRNWLDSV